MAKDQRKDQQKTKLKNQLVRGTHDLLVEDMKRQLFVIGKGREVAARYGFAEVATPIFEFTEVFAKTLGETSDIVSKEMYCFDDRGGESLTLRPEGTAGIARAIITHSLSREAPLKYFYQGPMFRYERPQKGRQRQFHQCGVELVGISNPVADIEIISLADVFLRELDLSGDISLEINSIGDVASRKAFRESFVEYLSAHKNKLSEDSQKRLGTNPLRILDSKSDADQKLLVDAPVMEDFLNDEARAIYESVCEGLDKLDIKFTKNNRLVRGLDYYCHCVFEFKTNSLGAQDAVLSGGRYDNLVNSMGGPKTPATGWAAGIERLVMLSQAEPVKTKPVALIPIGDNCYQEAIKLAHELRKQGLGIELAYSGNLGKRMKKADKADAKAAVIFGDDELSKGEFILKDLKTGDQKVIKRADLAQKLTSN